MERLQEILNYNKAFVEGKQYEKYQADKYPEKKMVIFSCMDTRLTQLLPEAMDLKNGDAKIIKNAGATIMHPFDSIMRSIIVAVYELKAEEVYVIGHHGCGMSCVDTPLLIDKMKKRGVSEDVVSTLEHAGINLKEWLKGFDSVHHSVEESVNRIKNHPLMPKDVVIHGLIIDPKTGELKVGVDGGKV